MRIIGMPKCNNLFAMKHSFTVVIEPAEEGGYIAHVPALSGCITQGESVEESLEYAKEAIEGYLEAM